MDVTMLTRFGYEVLGGVSLLAAATITGFGIVVALVTMVTEVIPEERRE